MDFVANLTKRAQTNPKHIVLPEGDEPRMLHAARRVVDEKIVSRLTILGNIDAIKALARKENVSLENIELKDPVTSGELGNYSDLFFEMRQQKGVTPEQAHEAMKNTLNFGMMMVHTGDADGAGHPPGVDETRALAARGGASLPALSHPRPRERGFVCRRRRSGGDRPAGTGHLGIRARGEEVAGRAAPPPRAADVFQERHPTVG